jgi:hypothetical protein
MPLLLYLVERQLEMLQRLHVSTKRFPRNLIRILVSSDFINSFETVAARSTALRDRWNPAAAAAAAAVD